MIVRGPRDKNYTILKNTCVKDPNLSARAKGIHTFLMSLPDDWKLYKRELYTHFKEGMKALNTAFKELEQNGYIYKEPIRVPGGRLGGWKYTVFEEPTEHPVSAMSVPCKSDNCSSGSRQLLSTNGQSPDIDKGLIQGKTEIEKEKEIDELAVCLEEEVTLPTASMVKQKLLQYQSDFPSFFPVTDPVFIAASLVNEQVHLHSMRLQSVDLSLQGVAEKVRQWFEKRYADPANASYAIADVQYIEMCHRMNFETRRSADQFAGRKAFHSNLRQLFYDLESVGATLVDYRTWLKKRRRLSVDEALSPRTRQGFCSEFGEVGCSPV